VSGSDVGGAFVTGEARRHRDVLPGRWHTLRPRVSPDRSDAIRSLDVSVLQDQLLAPILKIADVRSFGRTSRLRRHDARRRRITAIRSRR